MGEKKKKIVKSIKIDLDKCNGCRSCEVICSALHAAPGYSSNNPARSRIRVIREPIRDESPQENPLCVQWCINDALIYEEREEEVEEDVSPENVEIGLEKLANRYG